MVDKIVDNAVNLITEQMSRYQKGQAERGAGRLLIKLCETNPQAAELIGQDIVQESMSLAKATNKVREAARAQAEKYAQSKWNQTGECEFDDEDYLEILCAFYGVDWEVGTVETTVRIGTARKVISFMDLLGG